MLALVHPPSPRIDGCQRMFVARQTIDADLAARQHAAYCQALADCGVTVRLLSMNRDEPDCVFLEDTGVVLDEVAVLCPMGTAARRGEPAGIEPVLAELRRMERIELPATLEGGDVLRVGRRLLVGQSPRTNAAGIEALAAISARYGYRVTAVPVRGCLHLKTACTALPDGRLLVNANWIDTAPLAGFTPIPVPADESFAANILPLGERVLLPAEHPGTAEQIERMGFPTRAVQLSELLKGEGGVTCLSILVHDWI
jgi:dimethylargininase